MLTLSLYTHIYDIQVGSKQITNFYFAIYFDWSGYHITKSNNRIGFWGRKYGICLFSERLSEFFMWDFVTGKWQNLRLLTFSEICQILSNEFVTDMSVLLALLALYLSICSNCFLNNRCTTIKEARFSSLRSPLSVHFIYI